MSDIKGIVYNKMMDNYKYIVTVLQNNHLHNAAVKLRENNELFIKHYHSKEIEKKK